MTSTDIFNERNCFAIYQTDHVVHVWLISTSNIILSTSMKILFLKQQGAAGTVITSLVYLDRMSS